MAIFQSLCLFENIEKHCDAYAGVKAVCAGSFLAQQTKQGTRFKDKHGGKLRQVKHLESFFQPIYTFNQYCLVHTPRNTLVLTLCTAEQCVYSSKLRPYTLKLNL